MEEAKERAHKEDREYFTGELRHLQDLV